jgi:hypothetical protein
MTEELEMRVVSSDREGEGQQEGGGGGGGGDQ